LVRRVGACLVSLPATLLLCCEAESCGATQAPATTPIATASTSASAIASASAAPSASGSTRAYDLASVHALEDLPALVEVRRAHKAKEYAKAAALLLDLAAPAGSLSDGDDRGRAAFLRGHLLQLAKDDVAAEKAYAEVPATSPLAIYAATRRAQILVKQSRAAEAITLLDPDETVPPLATDRHMAHAEALAATGDHVGAAKEFSLEKRSPRWVDASIRYAEEIVAASPLLDAFAEDAASAVRRVRVETPTSGLVARAESVEVAVRARMASKDVPPLTIEEQVTRANALFDAGRATDAVVAAEAAIASMDGATRGTAIGCKVFAVRAHAEERAKKRSKAAKAYDALIDTCRDDATRATAAYDAAKLAVTMKDADRAIALFSKVETLHPKGHLADDARLRAGQALVDRGDVTKGEELLRTLPETYPEGDMRAEALFRLALPRMKSGAWLEAKALLERARTAMPKEDGYFVAGRTAYFAAIADLHLGHDADGEAALAKVIASEPMTFAAAMAYATLAKRSADGEKKAKEALDHALASEDQGALFDASRTETTTSAFGRAVELLRVGEPDAAKRELASIDLLKEGDASGVYLSASLFAQVGELRAAYSLVRARADWPKHFPAGKWRTAWQLAYPRIYAEVVDAAAIAQAVPASTIWGVMREESAFDPEVVSGSDAYGLMQLIAPTAARYAKALKLASDPKSLSLPEINIPIGASYLRKLRAEFPDNEGLAIPSYNAGEGATHRWLSTPLASTFDLWVESIPYDETRHYTKRVLASTFAYVALYEPAKLGEALRGSAGK
jgi:soluble lytic murein transglycosylase